MREVGEPERNSALAIECPTPEWATTLAKTDPSPNGSPGTFDQLASLTTTLAELLAAEVHHGEAPRQSAKQELEELLSAMLRTHREAEAALRTSEERFRSIFAQTSVGIAIADLHGRVLDVNPAILRMFGRQGLLIEPRPITDHVHPEDAPAFIRRFGELTSGQRDSFRAQVRFVRPNATVLWTDLTASLVRTDRHEPSYVVGVIEDITERHRLRVRLRHQEFHDRLTRLPNRLSVENQLRRAFSADSPVKRVGLCLLDLDHFRSINDSLGPHIGDRLLLAVAGRLRSAASEHLVARTGGDQFTILAVDPPSLAYLRELAERVLSRLKVPFVISRQRLSITASLGIAEQAVTETWPDELQRAADTARTWAKAEGGGRWAVFDPERDAGEIARFTLAASVIGAVGRREFHLYYQPLVELRSGRLTGVEALVRWRHPRYGLLGPAHFIECAERDGTIIPLGRWVLAEACRQARAWVDQFGREAPFVSVNVAPRELAERGWLTEVSQALAASGLDPRQLQLEITERAVLTERSGAPDVLRALRDMGVRLAIDDFGTGYSNLSYLRRLPVHGLKIDGSFIRDIRAADTAESPAGKIVGSLISLAHLLGLTVTAEWVETAAQARQLSAQGCDLGQGLWFGDAVPAGQLELPRGRLLAG
ncbi:MAG: GGDEF domain-containing protein [Pseudonocardia sp.]|nr:GGDEF domain-containing protein [Pseudonocardia sp.]